jgi:hypothetical protein
MKENENQKPVFNPWWPNTKAGQHFWMLYLSVVSGYLILQEYAGTPYYQRGSERNLMAMLVVALSAIAGWYIVLVFVRFIAVLIFPNLRAGFDSTLFQPVGRGNNDDQRFVNLHSTRSEAPPLAGDSGVEAIETFCETDKKTVSSPENAEWSFNPTHSNTEPEISNNDKEEFMSKATFSEKPYVYIPKSGEKQVSITSQSEASARVETSPSATRVLIDNAIFVFILVLLLGLSLVALEHFTGALSPDTINKNVVETKQWNSRSEIELTALNRLKDIIESSPGLCDLSGKTGFRRWFEDSKVIAGKICRLIGVYDSIAIFIDEGGLDFSVPLVLLGQSDISEIRRADSINKQMFPQQTSQFRIWKAANGSYQRELRLAGLIGSIVVLEARDGNFILVPLYDIAVSDQAYVSFAFPSLQRSSKAFINRKSNP